MTEVRYYTTKQVAELFQVTTETVRNWISQGLLESVNIQGRYRIPASSLEKFATSRYGA